MKFGSVCCLLTLGKVEGHGYLANPVSRGVLASTTPHGLGAVGPGGHINTCGMTANGFANDIIGFRPNTNKYESNRDCISTLKIGSIFRAHVRVKAHHIGFMELRLCSRRLSSEKEDTDDCALLERAEGSEVENVDCTNHDEFGPDDVCLPKDPNGPFKWYLSPCHDGGKHVGAGAMGVWCDKFMYFKIPADLQQTEQATLQWYWKTGNSCTPGPNPGATCNYVKGQKKPDDWCAGQWPCVNCKTHPGSEGAYFDFSKPTQARKACSEIFTTCADVKLSNAAADTTGPTRMPKDAFEGNSQWTARTCQSSLTNVVYSDTKDPPTLDTVTGDGGGGGGGGDCGCDCCVPAWAEQCHKWATTQSSCQIQGGIWKDASKPAPAPAPEPKTTTPEPEPEPTTPEPEPEPVKPDPEPEPVKPDPRPVPRPIPRPRPRPSGGGCPAIAGNGQSATDEQCLPCASGQTWWPCNVKGLCSCTGLLETKSLVSDPTQCEAWTSISDRVDNDWCQDNCLGSGQLHPACNPDIDEAYRTCVCNHMADEDLLQQAPATKFSGSVAAKMRVTKHVDIDSSGHLHLGA